MFDKDKLSRDDFIGECTIPLAEVYQKRSLTNWYNIYNKGQLMGQLLVTFEFMPEGGQFNSMPGTAMGMQQGLNTSTQFNQGLNMQYGGMGMQQGLNNSGMGLQAGCLSNQQGGNLRRSFHDEFQTMPSPVIQGGNLRRSFHEEFQTMPSPVIQAGNLRSSYHEEILTMPSPVMQVHTAPMLSTIQTSYIPVKQELIIPTGGYSQTTTTTSTYHEEIIRSPTIARY